MGNTYNGSSLHDKRKKNKKTFLGKTLGNLKTFGTFQMESKIFLNIHILTGLCDAKDTFFITRGGTFSRQI